MIERRMRLVFPAVLALLATPLMSGLVTAYNLGVGPEFWSHWLKAWMVSLPAGLFVVYGVSPAARWLTERALQLAARPTQL